MGKLKDLVDDFDVIKRYLKTRLGLILLTVFFTIIWFFLFGNPFKENNFSFPTYIFPVFIIVIFVAWYFNKINAKVALGKVVKIGIAFYSDDKTSIEKIKKLIGPIIKNLKNDNSLDFCSVVLFEPNEIESSNCALKYLEKNHYGIENLLWLRIELGEIEKIERLIIAEGFICFKNIHKSICLHGISINLDKELDFISSTSGLSYIELNHFFEREQLKKSLRQIILYSLGVSCTLKMKFPEALSLLKAIYCSNDTILKSEDDEHGNGLKRIKIQAHNLLAGRLTGLLSGLYTQVSCEYHHRGELERAYQICLEAEKVLGRIPPTYWIFVQLARLSYELGKIEDAKIYTYKMQCAVGRITDEVILNEGFFSILENKINKVVTIYKKLNPENLTCSPVEVIAFLERYNPVNESQALARDYVVALLTTYYLSQEEGNLLSKSLLNILPLDKTYSKMRSHINKILLMKPRKAKQSA